MNFIVLLRKKCSHIKGRLPTRQYSPAALEKLLQTEFGNMTMTPHWQGPLTFVVTKRDTGTRCRFYYEITTIPIPSTREMLAGNALKQLAQQQQHQLTSNHFEKIIITTRMEALGSAILSNYYLMKHFQVFYPIRTRKFFCRRWVFNCLYYQYWYW